MAAPRRRLGDNIGSGVGSVVALCAPTWFWPRLVYCDGTGGSDHVVVRRGCGSGSQGGHDSCVG